MNRSHSRPIVVEYVLMAPHLQCKLRHPLRLERARIPKGDVAIGHVKLTHGIALNLIDPPNRAAVWARYAHVRRIMLYRHTVIVSDLRKPLLGYIRGMCDRKLRPRARPGQ